MILVTLALAWALLPGCKESEVEAKYGLIWQDEFEGPAGQLPNPEKWQFDVGTDWGNAQLEYDTDRAENVSLDGEGHLAITAREEEYAGQSYTAGRIKTKDLFERTHGRFEARIKLPIGQGIWPAFWLLGSDIEQVGWPQCGEIDIMENIGSEPSVIHGTVHGPGYAGASGISKLFRLPDAQRFADDFHEFAVEWEPEEIRWFVDGEEYYNLPARRVLGEWVYDHPFFIILNVAVGGQWPGYPDETTIFPQQMLVDYVRIYEKSSGE